MSRARNIKPGFFKNDRLAECQPLARILFAGLWCEADRAGRLEDRPKRLKAEYLGYDDCDADVLLNELADRDFIKRYAIDGKRYIAVLAFGSHQNPHVKEAASTIPAPESHCTNTVQATTYAGTGPADSPSLIPDSPSHAEETPPTVVGAPSRFTEFWDAYPNKTARKLCAAKWKSRKLDAQADLIIADVKRRAVEDDRWLGGFVPNPETYINQDRWLDPIQQRKPATRAPQQPALGGASRQTKEAALAPIESRLAGQLRWLKQELTANRMTRDAYDKNVEIAHATLKDVA